MNGNSIFTFKRNGIILSVNYLHPETLEWLDIILTTDKMSKTQRKSIPYNEFYCTQCGKQSNRHSNAAQVNAILLQIKK